VYQIMGLAAYGRGHWPEAIHCLENTIALDPTFWSLRIDLAAYYRKLRHYTDAERQMQLALNMMPAQVLDNYRVVVALAALEKAGDLAPLRKFLAGLPHASDPHGFLAFDEGFILHLFERDADATAQTLAKFTVDPVPNATHLYPRAWYAAQLDRLRGDSAQAQKDFTVARAWMEEQVTANPSNGWMLSMLGLFDAGLGRVDEATQEALRAVDLEPYGHYVDEGSFVRGNLALVYAWTGRTSQALDVLEAVADKPGNFETPAQPSYGDLLLNPCWDSLRGDPRFQRVLERFQKPVPGS
jgi:tetratricopeptide (TPR) repeat protein